MSVATIAKAKLTSQQIADFMLVEDWARRNAIKRGDWHSAAEHEREIRKLSELLK